HSVGLSGKSFVPLIMGFGCSVPAIMSTRTLETEKDRRLTAMLVPFMSCGAKMPVYSLFIIAFFPHNKWIIVCSLYFLGIIVAIICALILQKTKLKGAHAPFVLELPPYRMPTAKTLFLHLWEKIKDFLSKAGTVLLGASIVIWFCQYFNFSLQHVENSAQSILGILGTTITPIFAPLGFGNWEASVAVISGLVARESIVSSLGILYGAGETAGLATIMGSVFTPASAYSFMVFCLLSIPCVAAITTLFRELKSFKWASLSLFMQASASWIVTFIVYNICKLIL
ncbi:MAG: ferrous iron transporter B, partial [Oscillospiraceae bacterium]